MYSEITLDHFHNPRFVGEVPSATGHARRDNPVCGDVAEFWVRVEEGLVTEVGFRAFGCAAAIAACSLLASMVREKPVATARQVAPEDLVAALGGLPRSKTHGASLAVEALRAALDG